eukprot:13062149-Alexandrium_andersonii.AAC.1
MQTSLLRDLRAVASGTAAPSSLIQWVVKFQQLDDSLVAASLPPRSAACEAMLELVLLSDLLKNTDDLKKAMLKSCELMLPAGFFQSMRDVLSKVRAPAKGE